MRTSESGCSVRNLKSIRNVNLWIKVVISQCAKIARAVKKRVIRRVMIIMRKERLIRTHRRNRTALKCARGKSRLGFRRGSDGRVPSEQNSSPRSGSCINNRSRSIAINCLTGALKKSIVRKCGEGPRSSNLISVSSWIPSLFQISNDFQCEALHTARDPPGSGPERIRPTFCDAIKFAASSRENLKVSKVSMTYI